MGMAVKPIILKTAEKKFTDREEPRAFFWKTYNALLPGELDVITYYGIGGIGKSALLKQLGREMNEKINKGQLDYIYYSFESNPSKEEFLYSLSRKMMLRNKNMTFPLFDTAVTKFVGEGDKNLSIFDERNDNIIKSEGSELVKILLEETVGGTGTVTKIAKSLMKLAKYVKSTYDKEYGDAADLYSEIENSDGKKVRERLQLYFAADALRYLQKRTKPFVIFLDGYEQFVNPLTEGEAANLSDSWLRNDLVLSLPNVIWVVSGRNNIHWDFIPDDNRHRIGDLSEADAAEFLMGAGVDESLVSGLWKLTNGTPAFLDLCVDTYMAVKAQKAPALPELSDFGNNTEELAYRYLKSFRDNNQLVLRMLSCFPNVWTVKMAADIAEKLEYGPINSILDNILTLSIFEITEDGYRLHEVVRKVVRQHTAKRAEIQSVVADYLADKITGKDEKSDKRGFLVSFCEYLKDYEGDKLSEEIIADVVDTLYREIRKGGFYDEGHIDSIIDYLQRRDYSWNEIVKIRSKKSEILDTMGYAKSACEYAEETFDIAKRELTVNDDAFAKAYSELRSCYQGEQFDGEKSIQLSREVYELAVKTTGEMSSASLSALYELGKGLSHDESKYEEGIELLNRCYELLIRKNGITIEAIQPLLNIKHVYLTNNRYDDSIEIQKKILSLYNELTGKNSPESLTGMYELMKIYTFCDDEKKVEEVRDEILSVILPVTSETGIDEFSMCKRVYLDRNQVDKAIEVTQQYYELIKRDDGVKDDIVIPVLNDLIKLYKKAKNYNAALEMQLELYNRIKVRDGEESCGVLKCMVDLGMLYERTNRFDKVDEVRERYFNLVANCEKLKSELLSDYWSSIYMKFEQYDKALEAAEQRTNLIEAYYGKDSSAYAECQNRMGELYVETGKPELATSGFEISYNIEKDRYGSVGGPAILYASELCEHYVNIGDYDKAKAFCSEIITALEEARGENDYDLRNFRSIMDRIEADHE